MHRKKLNFKSIIFKVFISYLGIYFLALIFRYNVNLESLLIDLKYKYLILMNLVSIFLGLPITILFDFILIKIFGLFYILFFAPVLTSLGLIQVIIFRAGNIKISKNIFLIKKIKNNNLFNFFNRITLNSNYIFILRTFPVLPFLLGSYLIASSNNNKKTIFFYSLLGSYLYYFSLFLIIKNG